MPQVALRTFTLGDCCATKKEMMDWASFGFGILSVVILFLFVDLIIIIFLLWTDCDFVTLLAEKFGKNPATVYKRKVVWLTGASSGIGEALAKQLAKYGAKIVLSARREDELDRVKRECLELNSGLTEQDILVLPLDMVNLASHDQALETILNNFGKVDVLINNAGRYQKGDWHETDVAVDKDLFELNVFSVVNMSRLVVNHFLQTGGGQVAVMSSVAAKIPNPLSGSYSASKHALHGYFSTLRTETYDKNIHATVICPGPVQTRFFTEAFADKPGLTVESRPLMGEVSENRMTPERCAYLALVAMANRINEPWLSKLPLIPLVYANVYFAVIADFIAKFFTPNIIRRMKTTQQP
ncbi:unnamed protein product [Allacma fusca]|uniref:Dehydrogenase/reductase SDR family member 7 n=1 Tax=Allacma fusca TaxID=39272 RepID=A0A8J2LQZ1_9HEXA|nr:unnamed protein product [Allacma fusca]